MTIEEIFALGDFEKIQKELAVAQAFDYAISDAKNEYDPKKHAIFDLTKRPDKSKKKKTTQRNPDGSPIMEDVPVYVARIAVPFQKVIVERVVGLFLGNEVKMKQVSTTAVPYNPELDNIMTQCLIDNKIEYKNRAIARSVFSTMEAAEYWYLVDNLYPTAGAPKYKLKVAIFSPLNGDQLFPHFDTFGDMDAFSRSYTILEGTLKVECFDIYTATQITKGKKVDGKWVTEVVTTNITKIPIVYYRQGFPEWANVQNLIERYETLLSNYADTNDYFGSPMVIMKGKVSGFSDKGDTGKQLQLEGDGASVSYLTWDQAPEAVKLELDTLRYLIFTMSMTHDIGSDVAKGLGTPSTQSMKFMFLDPLNKVKTKEEIFGECFQRRINVIKEFLNVIDVAKGKLFAGVQFTPIFRPALPDNVSEEINTIASAVTGGFMSVSAAVRRNPMIDNVQEEIDNIASDKVQNMAESFSIPNEPKPTTKAK